MDTQTQVSCFMAVASQETLQTTQTIDVMVATTSPLMQDRKLPSSTYRYMHVRACLHTKHMVEVILSHGDFRGRLENFLENKK